MVEEESGKLVSERIQPDSMKWCWWHYTHTIDAFNHKSNRNNKSPLNNFMTTFLRLLVVRIVLYIFHITQLYFTPTQRIINWLALFFANEMSLAAVHSFFLLFFMFLFELILKMKRGHIRLPANFKISRKAKELFILAN